MEHQLRLQRLKEVRKIEKTISHDQTLYYQRLKSYKKQHRQELIQQRREQEELKRMKVLVSEWQHAVFSTGTIISILHYDDE